MKVLIAIIVGAIIGYFTNLVAIKMLFRPYEEKYIFGIKLPFTPGLIPKEQDRIARSVGDTVEEYLLSPEIILESLGEKNLEDAIKSEIDSKINYYREEEIDLGDLLRELGLEEKEFEELIEKTVVKSLNKAVESGSVENFIDKSLLGLSKLDLDSLMEEFEKEYDLREKIYQGLDKKFLESENNNRKLEELVGETRYQALLDYIDENQNLLAYKLRKFVATDQVRASVEETITRVLEDNMPGLVIGLISMDFIAERIYQAFEDYLRGPEASRELNKFLRSLVARSRQLSIGEIKNWINNNIDRQKLLRNLADIIRKEFKPEDISKSLERNEKFKDLLVLEIKESLSRPGSFMGLTGKLSKELAGRILRLNIVETFSNLGLDQERLYGLGLRIFKERLSDKLPIYIEKLELGKIVEKTIREFDCEFAEKLVLDIASKELKAITRLGGVLGGLIGLISPLLQML